MKKLRKRNEGITLIALVVTIVVLLILAATSISMLMGENGIITQAQDATIKTENGEVYETLLLKITDHEISNEIGKNSTETIQFLLSSGYIDSDNVVNVKNLSGKNMKTGNGSNNKDIYIIEGNHLYYYDNKGDKTDLGEVLNTKVLEETDPDLFEITQDGTISLKDYADYYKDSVSNWPHVIENIVIPSEINGITVTKIGESFSTHYKHVKTVYIPDTVTTIDAYAFVGCDNLKEIRLSESLSSIEAEAFAKCSNLTEIEIPGKVKTISRIAFNGCDNLKKIIIKNIKNSIPEYAPWGANNAEIVYDSSEYENFANNYLKNKSQEELEELVLKSMHYLGEFDDWLQDNGNTREEFEQMASSMGMTYVEYLKYGLEEGMEKNSWVYVEYVISVMGLEEKSEQELEDIFIQDIAGGIENFNKIIQEQGLTKEQFYEKACSDGGFRNKTDFLKFCLYDNY